MDSSVRCVISHRKATAIQTACFAILFEATPRLEGQPGKGTDQGHSIITWHATSNLTQFMGAEIQSENQVESTI